MSSTKGIDFSKLSLKDALDLAVLIEEEARDRYVEFAEQMEGHRTPEAARFFRYMSANEEKHRSELAARRTRLFNTAPMSVSRVMIFDVEAPEYDEARATMSLRQALDASLRAETKALEFFDEASRASSLAPVRSLFAELREEEREHQELVRREIARLPAAGPARDDDEDEIVAQ